jgi:polysaccharide biosynthesis transport protein
VSEAAIQQNSDETVDFKQLATVLKRRYRIAAGVACLVAIAGGIGALNLQRRYQATASMVVEQQDISILGRQIGTVGQGASYGYFAATSFYETQVRVITSKPVLERAAIKAQLQTKDVISKIGNLVTRGQEHESWSKDIEKRLVELGVPLHLSPSVTLKILRGVNPGMLLRGGLSVKAVPDTRIIEISFKHPDPAFTARVANAVADAYITQNLDMKVDTASSAVNWLTVQVAALRKKVQESEEKLHRFREANNMVAISLKDSQSLLSQQLLELNTRLTTFQSRRMQEESLQVQVNKIMADPDANLAPIEPDEVIVALKKELLVLRQKARGLSVKYTQKHPQIKALRIQLTQVEGEVLSELRRIRDTHKHSIAALEQTERRLSTTIEKLKLEALSVNKKAIELGQLQRDVDNNTQMYTLLLKRQKEATLSQFLKANNARMLEFAVEPQTPVEPRMPRAIALILIAAFILGVFSALLAEAIDNSIKSVHDIEQATGTPALGLLPALTAEDTEERDWFAFTNPRSPIAECVRAIRTNLLFMRPDDPAKLIMVTSANPSEGKSTVAVNLGIVMAQSGLRTVVVDCDMRRPRQHKSFAVDNATGVTNVVVHAVTLDEALVPSKQEDLTILPCGPTPPAPAELMHSTGFKGVIDELRQRFDRVIFDSPPVNTVTDSLVLATLVDGVVFVAMDKSTTTHSAKIACNKLKNVGGTVLGAVLNNVSLAKDVGYYTNYYGSYYARDTGEI